VKNMVDSGNATFYQHDAKGQKIGYYSPQQARYLPMETDSREITVASLKANERKVTGNSSASVYDLGDGAALLEFHSQAYAIDGDLVEMSYKALDLLNSDFDALVVSHDGERFCIGANVFMVAMSVQNDMLGQLEESIKALQNLTQAMRYAPKPVVTAPFNLALGGGAELLMSGARVVAHAELYAGLVEAGVGLIPAGGGCKELVRRVITPVMAASENGDVLPHLQKAFEAIATAKVSSSAKEARDIGFLSDTDRIVMNRSHLIGEAKRTALEMANGYVPLKPSKLWAAGRDAYSALLIGIEGFRESGFASEYDAHIARKLAYVLTGGALARPQWVSEQYILDLEREAFMQLVVEPKTLERITYMLQNNKPLRN
ncbi:MAG: enoyl-CoA hydratase/isomerase family protein, partial [Anaerolineae bacterium]|nr:enoyl-CoA hydratase/isomerase family protein [Anaerolineae bacterium]